MIKYQYHYYTDQMTFLFSNFIVDVDNMNIT